MAYDNLPRSTDMLELSIEGELPKGLARIRVDQVIDRKLALQIFMQIIEHRDGPDTKPLPSAPDRPARVEEAKEPAPFRRRPITRRTLLRRALRAQPNKESVLKGRKIVNLSEGQLRSCLADLGVDVAANGMIVQGTD